MQFEAPYDAPTTIVLVKNPLFGDETALDVSVQYYQSINSTRYTYRRKPDTVRLVYSWSVMGRGKMLELEEFLQAYAGEFIRVIDHNSKIWKASIVPDAIVFTTSKLTVNAGGPRTESGEVTLEFIGCLKA